MTAVLIVLGVVVGLAVMVGSVAHYYLSKV